MVGVPDRRKPLHVFSPLKEWFVALRFACDQGGCGVRRRDVWAALYV